MTHDWSLRPLFSWGNDAISSRKTKWHMVARQARFCTATLITCTPIYIYEHSHMVASLITNHNQPPSLSIVSFGKEGGGGLLQQPLTFQTRDLSVHAAIPNSYVTLHLAGHATCGKIRKCELCKRRTRPFQIPLEEFTAARRLIPSKDSDALLEPQTFPQRYKNGLILFENPKSFMV